MSTKIGLDQVLRDPEGVARQLVRSETIFGLAGVEVRVDRWDLVCFWLTLDPWLPMQLDGFPTEQVAITSFDDGRVAAVPVGARRRRWLHRNPSLLGRVEFLGELCLWYPSDPPALRWSWNDGLVDFITMVHRHLQAEEYWRRTGQWPAEDAPHGDDGAKLIRTPALTRFIGQEAA